MTRRVGLSTLGLKEILAIVEPIMDNCLAGSNERNHQKHTRDFTDRMNGIVTPDALKAQLSGEPQTYFTERAFVALFRRRDSVGIVWKQRVSASQDELINQAIFREIDGKVLIDHCLIC